MKVHGALFCLVDFQDMGVKLGLANQTIFDFLMGHIIIEKRRHQGFLCYIINAISPVLPFARMDFSGRFCLRKNAPEFR